MAIVGVDTHKDVDVAVALDQDGRVVGHRRAKTTYRGYVALHTWAPRLAPTVRFGVEGTGSYGAGPSRFLCSHGVQVTEVRSPSRQLRLESYGLPDQILTDNGKVLTSRYPHSNPTTVLSSSHRSQMHQGQPEAGRA